MRNVLIVDDDPGVRALLSAIIRRNGGFQISVAESVTEASTLCTENQFDLIFLDHNLTDGIGWQIAEMISLDPAKYGKPRIITMSGSIPKEKADESRKLYSLFMTKPFTVSE